MSRKGVTILGSTGSVGSQTLEVIKANNESFYIYALSAYSNITILEKQIMEFSPKIVAVYEENMAKLLREKFPTLRIVSQMEGFLEITTHPSCDIVVSALSGSTGLLPTYKAVEQGKTVLLANKEILVCAGELIMQRVSQGKGTLIPVDSEHSALWQCMQGEQVSSIKKMIITASGGPFREYPLEALQKVTVEEALKHPTYKMGKKISIDSSTLMNKGLEVIEAYYLFGIAKEQLEVVVHPQSIVHSLVQYVDGSLLAQLSLPDMKLPIHYALFYPHRQKNDFPTLDFTQALSLQFFPLDRKKFPCFSLAIEALHVGKSMPCFMNAANEILVKRFLQKEILWWDIGCKLEKLMSSHLVENVVHLDDVLEIETMARRAAWVI